MAPSPRPISRPCSVSRGRAATQLLVGVSSWEGAHVPIGSLRHGTRRSSGVATAAEGRRRVARIRDRTAGARRLRRRRRSRPVRRRPGDPDALSGRRRRPGCFENDGGAFALDSANTRVLAHVGLVSGAMFADINGDGDADSLLAREWGSILLLLNDGRSISRRARLVGTRAVDESLERHRDRRPRWRRAGSTSSRRAGDATRRCRRTARVRS